MSAATPQKDEHPILEMARGDYCDKNLWSRLATPPADKFMIGFLPHIHWVPDCDEKMMGPILASQILQARVLSLYPNSIVFTEEARPSLIQGTEDANRACEYVQGLFTSPPTEIRALNEKQRVSLGTYGATFVMFGLGYIKELHPPGEKQFIDLLPKIEKKIASQFKSFADAMVNSVEVRYLCFDFREVAACNIVQNFCLNLPATLPQPPIFFSFGAAHTNLFTALEARDIITVIDQHWLAASIATGSEFTQLLAKLHAEDGRRFTRESRAKAAFDWLTKS